MNFYSAMGMTEYILIALVVVLVAVLVIMPIISNKKNKKTVEALHSSLKAGDKIMTIGGIIGVIKEVRQTATDKEIVFETGDGDNKTTMVIDIRGLYQVLSPAAATGQEAVAADSMNVDEKAPAEQTSASVDVFDETPAATETETAATDSASENSEPAATTKKTVSKKPIKSYTEKK